MSSRTLMPLSVNRSAVRKIAMGAFGLVLLAVVGVLAWLPSSLIVGALSEQPVDVWGELVPDIVIAAFCLLVIYLLGLVVYGVVRGVRYAAWLDGTVLAERGIVRVSRVDLATGEVDAGYDEQRDVQRLVARDRASGVVVSPPVTAHDDTLPAGELAALADAITQGRASWSGDRALVVAERLRRLAVDPNMPLYDEEASSEPTEAAASQESGESGADRPGGVTLTRPQMALVVLAYAAFVVPVLGVIVGLGYLFGVGTRAVVFAAFLALAFVSVAVREFRKMRREREREQARRSAPGTGPAG